jgi:diguanylate cyclase (GGDEF)-like protein
MHIGRGGRLEDPSFSESATAPVPPRALLLSVGALAVSLLSTTLAPELAERYATLLWLPALVPAFLLTYYRGWKGSSVGLAAAMATLVLSQAILLFRNASAPEWPFLMVVIVLWLAICLGVGWLGEMLHRARRQAAAVAFLDPLTGLPNRGHLRLFLDFTFGAAERGGTLTTVIFDLDNFKRVNDAHGHAAGDETLVAFAEVLRAHTRRADLTARFGGEEFVSVLTGVGDSSGATIFAERVRESLRTLPLPWGPVTVSVGISSYRPGVESPEMVLAEADRALYRAKREGRDRVVIHAPEGEASKAGS